MPECSVMRKEGRCEGRQENHLRTIDEGHGVTGDDTVRPRD